VIHDKKIILRVKTYIDFKIDIYDIASRGEGNYHFPVAQTAVSIQVRKQNGTGHRRIVIRREIWTDEVLGQMIRDAKEINPSIELDEYAQQLVETAE
jgi:hypothetical protein